MENLGHRLRSVAMKHDVPRSKIKCFYFCFLANLQQKQVSYSYLYLHHITLVQRSGFMCPSQDIGKIQSKKALGSIQRKPPNTRIQKENALDGF